MRTLIEFFDRENIENVISFLHLEGIAKVIFIGTPYVMTEKAFNSVVNLLNSHGKPEIEKITIPAFDFACTQEALKKALRENAGCVADVTGGTEIALVAAGCICTQEKIPLHIFDKGCLVPLINYSEIPKIHRASLTVRELIMLNGGSVSNKNVSTPELDSDIEALWSLSFKNPKAFSRAAFELSKFNSYCQSDGLSAEIPEAEFNLLEQRGRIVLEKLCSLGLIKISFVPRYVRLKYKSIRVKTLLTRVGELLEEAVFCVAKRSGFFDDVQLSVVLDWDGIHRETLSDTSNEIDVIITRDCIPCFISCKNCIVKKEYLYELQTVATRLGGKHARMALITTYPVEQSVYIRAVDMNIAIISLEKTETFKALENQLKKL